MTDMNSRGIAHGISARATLETTEPPALGANRSGQLGPRIFKNIVTLIGGQGIGLVLSGAATVLLARYLGATQLGEFGGLYAYLGLYGWLTTFGLESILARQVAQNRENGGSILLTGVCLSAIFALASMAIALLLAPSFGYSGALRALMVFAGVDILLLAPLRLLSIVFQVDLRQWYGVGISLFRQFLWLIVLAGLAVAKANLTWIILGRTACALLEVALIFETIRRKRFLARPWRILSGEARKYVSFGFPLAMSTLAVGVYQRIDQVMLHKMASDQVLGNYVASVRLTELISLFPIAVMTSLFPILSQTVGDEDRFLQYLRLSFRFLMALVFGVCIVVTLFAGFIVRGVYGTKFEAAGPSLAVLIWSEAPVFFGVVLSNGLLAKNLQNYLPFSTAAGAVLNVILNLYFIPRWGAVGSAWATNVSYALAAILLFLVFPKTRPMAWFGIRILAPPCLLALTISALLKLALLPGGLSFVTAIVLYGIGAWSLRIVRRSDLEQFGRLMGKQLIPFRKYS